MKRILVAGIGNVFRGDDGFGVETIRQLRRCPLPEEVCVADFGIRGYDLAFALTDGYDAMILVDAIPRGELSGTLSLLEPDFSELDNAGSPMVDAQTMDPVAVLQMARSLDEELGRLYLVACEPADLGGADGRMDLSDVVSAAVPNAVEMVRSLAVELTDELEAIGAITVNGRE